MLGRLWIAVALFAGGCSFEASCGGGKQLRMDKAEAFLGAAVEEDVGVAPTKVDCPERVPIEKGTITVCKVEVGGAVGEFEIVQEDDEGYITLGDARGLLIAAKLEAIVAKEIEAQVGTAVEVDCGEPVRASVPGTSFECSARDPSGVTRPVAITVKDDRGNVHFEMTAPPAAPSPAEAAPQPTAAP